MTHRISYRITDIVDGENVETWVNTGMCVTGGK